MPQPLFGLKPAVTTINRLTPQWEPRNGKRSSRRCSMPNNNNEKEVMPCCTRCESERTEIVSTSPVEGVWVIYNCPVCFYTWRSSEPDYAPKPDQYNPHFKIKVADIQTFAEVPI